MRGGIEGGKSLSGCLPEEVGEGALGGPGGVLGQHHTKKAKVSNEDKDPSGSAEAARESERIRQDGFLDAGIAHAPMVSPSVLRSMEDSGPSEMVNEDGSWKSHALEEESDPGDRGGLRRTLSRWFGR